MHVLCYGIKPPAQKLIEPWWCSPCSAEFFEPVCELCLQKGGALKKTTCQKWVHVICALFTEGAIFSNKIRMEPIKIGGIPNNREEKCVFCRQINGSCKCFQSDCKKRFHVTCAQRNNCLKECTNEKNNKIEFQAYCHQHKPQSSRRISSIFVAEKSVEKVQVDLDEKNVAAGGGHDVIDIVDLSSIHETSTTSAPDDGYSKQNVNDITDAKSVDGASNELVNLQNDDIERSAINGISCISKAGTEGPSIDRFTDEISMINSRSFNDVNNQFWWDFSELRRKESELESLLIVKDGEIAKVNFISLHFMHF